MTRFVKNPSKASFTYAIQQSTWGCLKGLVGDFDVFLWDAHEIDHTEAARRLGLRYGPYKYTAQLVKIIDAGYGEMVVDGSQEVIERLHFLKTFKTTPEFCE